MARNAKAPAMPYFNAFFCCGLGRPRTRIASTMALSALSRPSSAISRPMVTKSDGSNIDRGTSRQHTTAQLDTYRIKAYNRNGARSGSHLHQRRGADARHAPADAAEIRAARPRAADADDRQ